MVIRLVPPNEPWEWLPEGLKRPPPEGTLGGKRSMVVTLFPGAMFPRATGMAVLLGVKMPSSTRVSITLLAYPCPVLLSVRKTCGSLGAGRRVMVNVTRSDGGAMSTVKGAEFGPPGVA